MIFEKSNLSGMATLKERVTKRYAKSHLIMKQIIKKGKLQKKWSDDIKKTMRDRGLKEEWIFDKRKWNKILWIFRKTKHDAMNRIYVQ